MVQTITKIYSDIDLMFTKTPGRNDVSLSYDEMAVIRALKYLLLTNKYERPFQPHLGSSVAGLLFEPLSPITASILQNEIAETIKKFEPRIDLQDIVVNVLYENNAYNVTLTFFIGNRTEALQINLLLERTR